MITSAGADSIITCDLHADQIQGFFDIPVNQLYATCDFLNILKILQNNLGETLTLAAPDMGELSVFMYIQRFFMSQL